MRLAIHDAPLRCAPCRCDRLSNLSLGAVQQPSHHGPVAELGSFKHCLVELCFSDRQRCAYLVNRVLLGLPTLNHADHASVLFKQPCFQLSPLLGHGFDLRPGSTVGPRSRCYLSRV